MISAVLICIISPLETIVRTNAELINALKSLKPGYNIRIAPGTYRGGLFIENAHGNKDQPIVITALDRSNPPEFHGGNSAFQFSHVSFLQLDSIVVRKAQANGINIDDGGKLNNPSHNIKLSNIQVFDIPKGNHDGIKLSGIRDFEIINSQFENWGGSGIDMVGCHDGLILNCVFKNGGDNAVQTKGGSTNVDIFGSTFINAGLRGINIGGSTGKPYFRPQLDEMGPEKYEAKSINVKGCTFVNGGAPIAFVGVDGSVVSQNTFMNPGKWVIRILQETQLPGFVPSRNGKFVDNIVIFKSINWSSGGINVGSGTDPMRFEFDGNMWFCEDNVSMSQPKLPTKELNGTYGVDPELKEKTPFGFVSPPGSLASSKGAQSWNLENKRQYSTINF